MEKCKRCLLPNGILNIKLNENGICNYCTYFDVNKHPFGNYEENKAVFERKLNKVKGKYKYDAIVGISGGKDSSYVLYKIVKDYGLNVLAMTYDNGFLSNEAKKNVERVLQKINVDHRYFLPNLETLKKFYKTCLYKLGDACAACAIGGYFLAIKKAIEWKIPFVIHGRTPYQFLRNYFEGSKDLSLLILRTNFKENNSEEIFNLYSIIFPALKNFLQSFVENKEDFLEIYNYFFPDIKNLSKEFVPEFLAYFGVEPYNEENIKKFVEKKINYKRFQSDYLLSHRDCIAYDGLTHFYQKLRGINRFMQEISAMLRMGDLDKKEAEILLNEGQLKEEEVKESIKYFCNSIQLEENEFFRVIDDLKNKNMGKKGETL